MEKVVKNDEGKIVPKKCTKCGGDVAVQIHGEPIYICKDCGEYYGTVPCHIREEKDKSMPAKSKSQQRFFGMVRACQKGELENPSKEVQDAAEEMSVKDVKKFAKTKHKGLPERVEESIKKVIPDSVYIVCDGTSCYGVYGCDVDAEITENDVEIVGGPYRNWDDHVDDLIEDFNDEMYGINEEKTIKLTESELRYVIAESTKQLITNR